MKTTQSTPTRKWSKWSTRRKTYLYSTSNYLHSWSRCKAMTSSVNRLRSSLKHLMGRPWGRSTSLSSETSSRSYTMGPSTGASVCISKYGAKYSKSSSVASLISAMMEAHPMMLATPPRIKTYSRKKEALVPFLHCRTTIRTQGQI